MNHCNTSFDCGVILSRCESNGLTGLKIDRRKNPLQGDHNNDASGADVLRVWLVKIVKKASLLFYQKLWPI